jgi:hypothetical protein
LLKNKNYADTSKRSVQFFAAACSTAHHHVNGQSFSFGNRRSITLLDTANVLEIGFARYCMWDSSCSWLRGIPHCSAILMAASNSCRNASSGTKKRPANSFA